MGFKGFKTLVPVPDAPDKFVLDTGNSGNTTFILNRKYPAGNYSVNFASGDTTYDIYAIAVDGTAAGYTNTATLTANKDFKEIVVLGFVNNDDISFDGIVSENIVATSKGDVASAGAFVTSVNPSSLPSIDDSVTVTGGNFAADVEAYFIDQSDNEVAAKTVVRNSSTEIVVTRPDSFSPADSPFTIKVVNPNVTLPTGTSAHLLSNAVTAGTNPVWQTAAAQFYSLGIANTITLVASDTEASDVDYAITAGSLPSGLTLDGETGVISGTPSGGADGDQTVFTVRATDDGGNFVDREFTFTANAAPIWTTTSSDIGEAGVLALDEAVSFQFVANGGTGGGSLSYSVQSGSLPTGTSIDSTGLLTGTPTVEQTVTFTLRVADEAGLFADREFSVVVETSIAMELISKVTSPSGSVEFTGLDQLNFKHLEIHFLVRDSAQAFYLQEIADESTYNSNEMRFYPANNSYIRAGEGMVAPYYLAGLHTSTENAFSPGVIKVIDYKSPEGALLQYQTGKTIYNSSPRISIGGVTKTINGLTNLKIFDNLTGDSVIELYGIK